jgi:ubiquinone/menaquinone biosynthesis C-methylase UbiE
MRRSRTAVGLAVWLRRSRATEPLRRHLPLAATAAGVSLCLRRRPRAAAVVSLVGTAGFVRTYLVSRRLGTELLEEHRRRMRRLNPEVAARYYVECVSSMEDAINKWPRYDKRKHEMRYRIVTREVLRRLREGDTVVDVGCASAIVLDRVNVEIPARRIGFDLATYGLKERAARADAPLMAQAVVEAVPLRAAIADVVVFGEVIEHLIDAYAGLREVSRICRPGGTLILTTNNSSEMPEISPLRDPLTWVERLVGRTRPSVLGFRNITWSAPIDRSVDPLPEDAPTYVPHIHFAFSELVTLAADAGFRLDTFGSFEFPAPQSRFADILRRLSERLPRTGDLAADTVDAAVAAIPGLRQMGTHHLLVFTKVAEARTEPAEPWWPTLLVDSRRSSGGPERGRLDEVGR